MSLKMALINSVGASPLVHFRLRTLMLRAAGASVDLRTQIMPRVVIRTHKLTLGRKSTINYQCVIDNEDHVVIGERVGIAIGVKLITRSHDTSDPECRAGVTTFGPIRIQDGAFLGSGVTVLPGVTIGAGCVVGANSVVTKDCEPHSLYVGTPAVRVKGLGVDRAGVEVLP